MDLKPIQMTSADICTYHMDNHIVGVDEEEAVKVRIQSSGQSIMPSGDLEVRLAVREDVTHFARSPLISIFNYAPGRAFGNAGCVHGMSEHLEKRGIDPICLGKIAELSLGGRRFAGIEKVGKR